MFVETNCSSSFCSFFRFSFCLVFFVFLPYPSSMRTLHDRIRRERFIQKLLYAHIQKTFSTRLLSQLRHTSRGVVRGKHISASSALQSGQLRRFLMMRNRKLRPDGRAPTACCEKTRPRTSGVPVARPTGQMAGFNIDIRFPQESQGSHSLRLVQSWELSPQDFVLTLLLLAKAAHETTDDGLLRPLPRCLSLGRTTTTTNAPPDLVPSLDEVDSSHPTCILLHMFPSRRENGSGFHFLVPRGAPVLVAHPVHCFSCVAVR